MMADIRLQLARYAQGIHWVQKNFLLDESVSALLVTAGLPVSQQTASISASGSSHVVLRMQPDFDSPFPAPESWNKEVVLTPCTACSAITMASAAAAAAPVVATAAAAVVVAAAAVAAVVNCLAVSACCCKL